MLENSHEEIKNEALVNETHQENFEKMLAESLEKNIEIEIGDEVEGSIVNISDEYIFVSLGGKLDAFAERAEFLDENAELQYKIGDTLKGFIVKKTDSETIISKSFSKSHANKEMLKEAFDKKIPVNGKVMSAIKGGFTVDLLGIRAFCPVSQLDIRKINDVSQYIGRNFDFEVMDYAENGKNIVVTRRPILERESEEKKKNTMEKIIEGAVLDGFVSRITTFGAFVDLGGIEGLLHISELSWNRVENTTDVINTRDKVKVKIIKIDGEKISLSMKALQINPLEEALQTLKEGEVVKGKILRSESFGSFMEIKPGVEGLIPISEMSRGKRIAHPSEVVKIGDIVEAEIIKIKVEERKISLSLKSLQADPWDVVDTHLEVEHIYEGVIENVSAYGVFIQLYEGITGLLPKSRMAKSGIRIAPEHIGSKINVKVTEINKEKKRISLDSADSDNAERVESEENQGSWKRYAKEGNEVPEDNPFMNL